MEAPSVRERIMALADERANARAERDWARADELKARIEEAGWRVVDMGTAYDLFPASPPDLMAEGQTLYGAVESVPSRFDEAASLDASIIVLADMADPGGTLDALAAARPEGAEVIVITAQALTVAGLTDEVVRTVEPLTAGDALQAGLRRSRGAVVVVLEAGRLPDGDIVTPLVEALRDPDVAIVSAEGLVSTDLHRYRPIVSGDATTAHSGGYAFRREEAIARGPIDGKLELERSVAAWLGLCLRDEGPDRPPRRAAVVALPLGGAGDADEPAADYARLVRRDNYRIARHFSGHRWLTSELPPEGWLVGDGTDGGDHHDEGHHPGHTDEP